MEQTQEVSNTGKTTIRPDVSKMVKTKSGSYHKGDDLGNALDGLTLEQVKEIGAEHGVDTAKYANLNAGQQRMNIGNRLRAIVKKDESGDVIEKIRIASDKFRQANESASAEQAAAKAAEKEAKAKAKEEAKAAEKAAKAAKAAEKAEKAESEPKADKPKREKKAKAE